MRHPFLRTLAAPPRDPNFENVTLLMHGDGTNGAQNSTFLDSSTNNFTVTLNGEVQQGTFSPFGDNWSNFFDGTGDYLTAPDNAAFDFGTGDFTIECWVYINANSSANSSGARPTTVFSTFPASGTLTAAYAFVINGSTTDTGTGIGFSNWQSGVQSFISATATVSQHKWNHIAVARSGTTTKLFLNGSEIGSGTLSNQTVNCSNTVQIGRTGYTGFLDEINGFISNLRVLKGTAQYTGSYSVPTVPLTAIANTVLLTCKSNRFRDESTNNFTITRNGDVSGCSVHRFSPFSPVAAYSTSAIAGSAYIDFNLGGSWLQLPTGQTPLLMGSSDFTFEAWVYRDETIDSGVFSGLGGTGGATDSSYIFLLSSSISSEVYQGGTARSITSPDPVIRQWAHVAWVRTGGTFSSYLNGARVGTVGTLSTTAINNGTSVTPKIGDDGVGLGYTMAGYISGARIIKGSGGYDATSATITVPTAPPTAITNTSALLNFTNAGLFDSSGSVDLLTLGDAKIDTTTKKYGSGSMRFDGTGDNLQVHHMTDQLLRAGPFTIELWVYLSATGAARGLICKGGSTTGWLVSTNASNAVVFTHGTSTITSTGTLSATTWYHIAVVREGTGTNQTKIYINGTNDGTGTVSTDFTQVSDMLVGCNRQGTNVLNGYIDDIRVTKGVARYTANFTAPTAAFPDL